MTFKHFENTGTYEPLMPLIEQARREGKWLFCSYQQIWMAPDELEKYNRDGQFRWGPRNWTLRNPAERLAEIDRETEALGKERERFRKRIELNR